MKRLLLKISGEFFAWQEQSGHAFFMQSVHDRLHAFTAQLAELRKIYRLGIVIGGGNIFRGNQHSKLLGLTPQTGHHVGMLATVINGICLQDILVSQGISARVFSALEVPHYAHPINRENIEEAFSANAIAIFTGGCGQPFFSTDTAAVVRGLQIGAVEIWKCTKVDGIYDKDPVTHPDAIFLPHIGYQEALDKKLCIMDRTAIDMAQEHRIPIRVINLAKDDTLLQAHNNANYGSRMS